MNQIRRNVFHILAASLFLCTLFAAWSAAQNGQPKPSPTMPPGMKGSDPTDPRSKLSPGLFNAGEAAFGIRHVLLLKKPESFQLGTDNPDDPKVLKILAASGTDLSKLPKDERVNSADWAFANSDMAFQGNRLFLGNYYGINIYDISDPARTSLLTSMVCPGGQGDVSVYKNLMFMSVETLNGRLDCGEQGFPVAAVPAAGQNGEQPRPPQKDRFRGVRIFDISDIRSPKQIAAVQTCRGSHTHTLLVSPNDKDNVYIYVSGTSDVRPNAELEGCSAGPPETDPNTALFRIEVIKVPLAEPQNARVISTPRIFSDPKTGAINALSSGGGHDTQGRPFESNQCHDITVYPELGLAAGACAGNGILLDIKDPANPKRIDAVNDPNYAYWHSASFSNDGKKVIFTDEWGGGSGPKCRVNDPNKWGANSIFHLENNDLRFANYYKLPAAQTESENCVAHNGSLIPVPGRDLKVQAWYQGGISIMDFTDAANPMEVGYFDRGPIDPNTLIVGGSWSAYWYNGYIYSSEIIRGLDIMELTPTKYLTQNEIDAAKAVRFRDLNVQSQKRIVWPRSLVVAKAYIDQLERAQALPANRIATLRKAIGKAEKSGDLGKLKSNARSVEKSAGTSKSPADSSRMLALAEILKNPER